MLKNATTFAAIRTPSSYPASHKRYILGSRADLGPMEHTFAEYPVVRGSSPRAGWLRMRCAFTASTASALAILLVTAAPNGAKAQASAPPLIPPAAQAVAASGSSKGAPLFVAADPDLVAKEGVAQDSWFVVSHLTSGSNRLDLLVHYIRLVPPQGPVIQAIVSVLDPVSGESLAEEKDYKASETTFSAASLDVRTPSGRLTGRASGMHLTGQFSRIQLDLMLDQQGPLLANFGDGAALVLRRYQLRILPAEHEDCRLRRGRWEALPGGWRVMVRSAMGTDGAIVLGAQAMELDGDQSRQWRSYEPLGHHRR
jgi:hypothetical protein